MQHEITKEEYIAQYIMYGKILCFLLLLTGVTFLQPLFIPKEIEGLLFLQFLIAGVKAFLIISYYMHLKYESQLFKSTVYFTGGILLIFFIIVGIDSNMDDSPLDLFQTTQITTH